MQLDEITSSNKSSCELSNNTSIHQVRKEAKNGRGRSLAVEFQMRNDVSINSDDVETISGEFLIENRNYAICKVLYRQPKGQIESFEKNLKETFSQIKNLKKQFHLAGDLNLIVFDHEICKKVQQFLNIIYENGMIPIINKPIRVTNKAAIVIGHILEKFLTYDH